ncbi:MAG: hypothetical protein J2P45_27470, partial [Candidatus Dormibacteraeota bacterium]|nr:hypothetical protein [Candidatus Dormibacteraeota bacterium]
MVRRALDVVFQHLGRLLAVIVLVPVVVGGVALTFTRTNVITARLWADSSAVSGGAASSDPTAADFDPNLTPAQRQAALLAELVQTNSFMNRAFQAGPAVGAIPRRDRSQLQQAVRAGFTATA